MEGSKGLTPEQIAEILAPQSRSSTISTEPREISIWYKQNHVFGTCENPDCSDPRPAGNRGREIMAKVNERKMCRYCFLGGWLSPSGTT